MDADMTADTPADTPALAAPGDTAPLPLTADDVAPEERDRAAEALRRFRVRRVLRPGRSFDTAYNVLHEEFGPRGEIEARADLAHDLLHAPHETSGAITYELMTFHDTGSPGPDDPDGRLAGVRDVFTCRVPGAGGAVVVLLSHSLILPAWRRSGLGALIRAAPARIARQRLLEAGGDRRDSGAGGDRRDSGAGGMIALVAEMDPISPAQDATLIRYLAYCRSGFVVVPAREIRYFQPDFSGASPEALRGLPMTMVVRILDGGAGAAPDNSPQTSEVEDKTNHLSPIISTDQMRAIYAGLTQIHRRHYAPCADYRAALMAGRLAEERGYRAIRVRRDRLVEAIPLLRGEMLPLFDARSGGIDAYTPQELDAEHQMLLLKWSQP